MLEKSELFEYFDHANRKTFVWVRLYRYAGWTTVLATDRSSTYQCRSITNSVEEFATQALIYYALNPHRVVWIEHYDGEPLFAHRRWFREKQTFVFVTFNKCDDGRYEDAIWKHTTREIAEQWTGEEIVDLLHEVTR